MIKKLLAVGALAGALILAGGSAAMAVIVTPSPSASPYTGGQVQENTVAPGGTVTYTSGPTNLAPGTPITVSVNPSTGVAVSGPVVVAANGTFTFSVTVPANATPGSTYTGTATGTDAGGDRYTFGFTIKIAAAPADGRSAADGAAALPPTGGADTSALLWFGAGALALGGAAIGVVTMTRRKAVQN